MFGPYPHVRFMEGTTAPNETEICHIAYQIEASKQKRIINTLPSIYHVYGRRVKSIVNKQLIVLHGI